MNNAQDVCYSSFRQLESEWSETQERWHDSTTEYFARSFWEPLAGETETYQRALDTLMETLNAAQEAVSSL